MQKKLIARILTITMIGASCVIPAYADEGIAYTPAMVFEETFPGADGTDLVNSDANKEDNIYFSSGFTFINGVKYSNQSDRFGIIHDTSLNMNTIKRLSGQPMRTVQSIYKPLKNAINMNPTEKTVYYIKWSEYIQDQSPDGTKRYGGFQGMPEKPTSNVGYDACMIDFANKRIGAGIGNNGGKKMSAFVSYGIDAAPKWDSTELKENTWYDMILRVEANPTGTDDSMSLKVYETGTAPEGDFGAVAKYSSEEIYDKLSYYFRAQYCKRTAVNGKTSSDMAISANKAECFDGDGTGVLIAAENAVLALEEKPTATNKAAAESLVNQISTDAIAYGLLNSRISSVEIKPESELQSVRIGGNSDMIGALLYAETQFGDGIMPDIRYQWYRDDAEIFGANSADYKITSEDKERVITVSVTAGDTTKTSEGRTISDNAIVIADETIIESDIGVQNFDKGFSTGWRIMGADQKLSSSEYVGDKATVNDNLIGFKVSKSSTDKYMRGLSSPIYTNSDNVYYITWIQDSLSLDNWKNATTFQKVELASAEDTASNLIFGTNCVQGASVKRFSGLYKRDDQDNKYPQVYIYPHEKYRVVVRIDASPEEGKDCVYYKAFKENDLVREQPEWNYSDENFTINAECLDKLLVQSSTTESNYFGGFKIERYSADDIKSIDSAIEESNENAQSLIDALPDGIAKNDLTSKLRKNTKDTGVNFMADHTDLPNEGTDAIKVTVCNHDEVYYRNAKLIVAEYAADGSLLNAELKDMTPMQEQILSCTVNISAEADNAKLMLFEDMETITPLDECIVLQRQ